MNYAYRPGNFSGFSTAPWNQYAQTLSPFMQAFYNQNPDVAYQSFIQSVKPSNTSEDLLRRMFGNIRNSWLINQNGNPSLNAQSFTDYLKGYNFNQAFASVNPNARKTYSNNFNRPVRIVNF